MFDEKKQKILNLLTLLYGTRHAEVSGKLDSLVERWKRKSCSSEDAGKWVDQNDIMLITYGDSIKAENEKPLVTLNKFLTGYVKNVVTDVHILPMFPYTSDDGFSVVDYYEINQNLGDWEDIKSLSENFSLMFDAVVNHLSKSSRWFEGFLRGEEKYREYFIVADPTLDYSKVTRPRTLPLLTPFKTSEGEKYVWTTFSEDQVDLNYGNPEVLLEVLEVLLTYACNGARFIRLDAIGFAWKKPGTTCMHLEETHAIVKLMRLVLDEVFPGTLLITETNVPHADNISYFGNGTDEAHLVYQFPLPPLVLFSFIAGDAAKLGKWAQSLEATPLTESTTYFNFLASHDGIGMRPAEGILTGDERELILDTVVKHGGIISYKTDPDGKKSPYELNINYMDALTDPRSKDDKERVDRFLAAQAILLSMVGVPGIYIHSLVGSQNWVEGVKQSGINRRINRETLDDATLCSELDTRGSLRNQVFTRFTELLRIRKGESAFSPNACQKVLFLDARLLSLIRHNNKTNEKILVMINVSGQEFILEKAIDGLDLIRREQLKCSEIKIAPYQILWIKLL